MASASVPFVEAIAAEFLTGKTVTVSSSNPSYIPQNPSRSNDRDALTSSLMNSAFAPGSHSWAWQTDLTAAQTVARVRVWDPVAADYWNNPTNAVVQSSPDNSTWTSRAHVYSSATVPTGEVFPDPTTTTEYRYTLVTPVSARYWRIVQSAGGGLTSGRGMGEWFLDGTTTAGTEIIWGDAPDTIDGSDATYDDVDEAAIIETAGPFWRYDAGVPITVEAIDAVLGFEDTGSVTLLLQAGELDDYSDATTVAVLNTTATGSLTADDLGVAFDQQGPFRYWQLVLE